MSDLSSRLSVVMLIPCASPPAFSDDVCEVLGTLISTSIKFVPNIVSVLSKIALTDCPADMMTTIDVMPIAVPSIDNNVRSALRRRARRARWILSKTRLFIVKRVNRSQACCFVCGVETKNKTHDKWEDDRQSDRRQADDEFPVVSE